MVLAAVAGILPFGLAFAIEWASVLAQNRRTQGLVPGDYQITQSWIGIARVGIPLYLFAVPLLTLSLIGVAARWSWRIRRRHRRSIAPWVVCVMGVLLGCTAWFAGLLRLAMTIWNE